MAKTFAELFEKSQSPKRASRGAVVEAKILSTSSNSILLDIGGKSEGIVTGSNFAEVRDFAQTLKVGDSLQVLITGQDSIEGLTQVSLRPASGGFVWEQLIKARDNKTNVKARVIEKSRGGLEVEVMGISSFIPNSQIGKQLQNAQDLDGRTLSVRVLDANKARNQLVLSERAISEKEEIDRQIEILSKLKQGEVMEGKVINVVAFGAFVEVVKDGVTLTGLVHKSEVSWDSSEELEPGQNVKVNVIGVKEANLSLSVKRAGRDPWTDATNLKKDSSVTAVVTRVNERNVMAQVLPGVEGTITRSKLPAGTNPKAGDKLNCFIENIDLEKHRLNLSLQLTVKPIGYK